MARETLKDFLSSQGLGADSISYTIRDDNGDGSIGQGDDLGVDPNTGKELLELTSEDAGILGDYLNFIQQNANVIFGVDPGNKEAVSSVRGNPLPHPENQGASNVFVEMGTSSPESITLIQNSNSGKFDQEDVKLVDIVDKVEGRDGHSILPSIDGRPMGTDGDISAGVPRPYPATPKGDKEKQIVNASVNILRENNRFTPAGSSKGIPYITPDQDEKTHSLREKLTIQREFGAFDGESFQVRMGKLHQIGRSLLSESGGFLDNEMYPEESLSSTVPVGKIESSDLRAKNADGFPKRFSLDKAAQANLGNSIIEGGESLRAGRGEFLTLTDTQDSRSYGSMTKDGDQSFDPVNKKYLRARAAIAVKTALVAIDTFKNIALESAEGSKRMRSSRGPYLMGENQQYVRTGVSFIMNSILVPTDNGYKRAANRGAKFLLKIDKNLGEISEENADDLTSKIKGGSKLVKTSPGYTLVLARSILLAVHTLQKDVFQSVLVESDDANELIRLIGKSRIVGLLNTFAIIGDIVLNLEKSRAGTDIGLFKSRGAWDVDSLPDGPTTRVSKSRTSDGFNQSALSMRTSATPSMYLLPKDVIRSSIKMGTNAEGVNPAKAMLGSTLAQQTFTGDAMTGGARIPSAVVKNIEDMLDAEYMPFYFHDLRTNEIISFHAFLSDLTDDYTAEFTETAGYGRMDAVQTYKGTKRGMGFGFTIAATSPEDFDEMWWKINKLVTLVYPQWTEGDLITTSDHGKFIQPFSQVIGASPLVRVRIGDVVKSNYSKFNLSRMFGIGKFEVKPELPTVGFGLFDRGGGLDLFGGFKDALSEITLTAFLAAYGSPLGHSLTDFLDPGSGLAKVVSSPIGSKVKGAIQGAVSNLLVNGFASPLLKLIIKRYKDPDNEGGPLNDDTQGYKKSRFNSDVLGTRVFIKANNTSKPYTLLSVDSEDLKGLNTLRFSRPVKCIVLSRSRKSVSTRGRKGDASPNDKSFRKTHYRVKIIDTNVPEGIMGAELRVNHSDIHHDPNDTFNRYMLPLLDPLGGIRAGISAMVNKAGSAMGIDSLGSSIVMTTEGEFMDASQNSITRAFESTQGRGLAGVIKNLKFTWLDDNTTWEIDWGSRAPMMCKVSITFAPIHDLPPGLDSNGFNRAPIYNVGRIMRYAGGDSHNDNGAASEAAYQSEHRKTFKKE